LDETRPDAADTPQTVFAHERATHHSIGDNAPGDRRRNPGQQVELRRRRDVDVELAVGVRATIRWRRWLTSSSPAAAPFRGTLLAGLLRPRRIRGSELVVERGLSADGISTRDGAHDPHAGAEYGDGADENESLVIGA